MPARVLETVLTGRNLLSPVLTGAAADVEAFDAKVTAATGRAAASADTNAKAQETAAAKVTAANTRASESSTVAADKVTAANTRTAASSEASAAKIEASSLRAAESTRGFAEVTESSAARASVAWARLATVGLPLVGAAVAVVTGKMAGDYQQLITKLETTAGESKANLGMVSQGLLDMAGQVGVAADELAKGAYTVESAGFHGADALKVMKAAAEGARQENADLGHVTDALTTILHDYHLGAGDAATVTSQLITAVSHGKISFDDMTASLHSVTPLAAKLNIPLSDVAGTLSAMTASGESADQATQNMRDALQHLMTPLPTQVAELAQLGITATDMSDRLGSRGLSGTLQDISQAILTKMGPAGKVLLDAFNQSKQASNDLQVMISSMPPGLAKLSQSLLDGTTSQKDYKKAALDLGGQAGVLGDQFISLYKSSDGFNNALKTGGPSAQSYESALQKATGTVAGMNVALMVTGENAGATNDAIKDIAGAAAQADGSIKGWDEVQGNFNQKLAEAGAGAKSLAIEAGQHLLPVLTGMVGWVADTGIPGIEHLGGAVGDGVHWFMQLPGPVKEFALALAGLRLADSIGLLDRLGGGVTRVKDAFAGWREEMALQQGLSAMQRSGLSDVERALGGLGTTAPVAESAVKRFGTTLGSVARSGVSALRSGLEGLMGMFGGPWGLALAGATVAIPAFMDFLKGAPTLADRTTASIKSMSDAIAGTKGAIDNSVRYAAAFQEQQLGLMDTAKQWGVSTSLMTDAALGNKDAMAQVTAAHDAYAHQLSTTVTFTGYGKQALDQQAQASDEALAAVKRLAGGTDDAVQKQKDIDTAVNGANGKLQTQIDKMNQLANVQLSAVNANLGATASQISLTQAVDDYNTQAADGTLKGLALKQAGVQVAQAAYQTAQAAAQQATEQLKANGKTDDGTLANSVMLQSLKLTAQHLTGPARDSIEQYITALQNQAVNTSDMSDVTGKMGLHVAGVWDNNTRVIKDATDQQIGDLENLGFKVTHLPDGKVVVTSDTGPARDQIDQMIKDYSNRVIAIAGGNFGPAAARVSSGGGYAEGGYTGDGGKYEPKGVVHGGEFVLTKEQTAKAGIGNLYTYARALDGYASGGLVGPTMYAAYPAQLSALAVRQSEAIIDQLAAQARAAAAASAVPDVGPVGSGMTWPKLDQIRRQLFPGSVLTSAYRPGANDWHGRGDAIDIGVNGNAQSGLMPIAATLARLYPGSTELIHNPNGSIKNGTPVGPSFWGPATWAEHANHVHWAMTPNALAAAQGQASASTSGGRARAYGDGGIITHPQYALVGEAGPEAIVPLSKPGRRDAVLAQAGLTAAAMPGYGAPSAARAAGPTQLTIRLEGARITGRLEVGTDGFASLVDARIDRELGALADDVHYATGPS